MLSVGVAALVKKDITFAETTDGDAIYEFVKLIRREGFNDYRFCSYLMI